MAKRRLVTFHSDGGYIPTTDPPTYRIPLYYTITTTIQTEVIEPQLDFYIPNNEFYLNIPAVSIASVDKSRTNFNDGSFFVMNKSSKIVYYKNITFNHGLIRASYVKSNNKVLNLTKVNTNSDATYTYEVYRVGYNISSAPVLTTSIINKTVSRSAATKQMIIGYLTLRYLNEYYNNDGKMISPFESIPFAASYSATNVGKLASQYYGKTLVAPNKNVGTLDFSFFVETYDSNPNNDNITPNILKTELVISVNVVNTGYVPSVYNLTLTPPPTGGGGYVPPFYILPVMDTSTVGFSTV